MTNRSADIGGESGVHIHYGREERYRPYPAYKDSGVEWLGEIPEHWEVKRTEVCCLEPFTNSGSMESLLPGIHLYFDQPEFKQLYGEWSGIKNP